MGFNTASPATFTTAVLIGDTVHSPNGGTDSIPLLTTSGGSPVSTCLEIQSTAGALLVSRMTTTQRLALTPADGMLVYDTTAGAMYFRENGVWVQSGPGNGNVVGPNGAVAGDIAIFADNTGLLLADSGVPITKVPQLALVNEIRASKGLAPLVNVNQIGNVGHIAFTNGIGLLFVDSLMPVEFIDNNYGAGNQVCALFTGDLPSSSTTPSALVELQSTTGAFLVSRMTTTQKNALTAPSVGMMVYDTTIGNFSFYNGAWFTPSSTSLIIDMAHGGTGANLTPSNGGIFYSTATTGAILAGTATAHQILLSGSNSAPSWSTATYPSTTTINQILFSSAANTVAGLATANSATFVTNSSGVPSWTSSMTNGQVLIGSTGATPTPATLTAGSGISITNAAGSITIATTESIASWTDVTTATQALATQNGYVTDRGAGVTYTLPATANLGDQILIVGKLGIPTINQNANQQILISSASSTVGVGGSVNGNNVGDCITLVCITPGASTVWRANSVVGNWTVI